MSLVTAAIFSTLSFGAASGPALDTTSLQLIVDVEEARAGADDAIEFMLGHEHSATTTSATKTMGILHRLLIGLAGAIASAGAEDLFQVGAAGAARALLLQSVARRQIHGNIVQGQGVQINNRLFV